MKLKNWFLKLEKAFEEIGVMVLDVNINTGRSIERCISLNTNSSKTIKGNLYVDGSITVFCESEDLMNGLKKLQGFKSLNIILSLTHIYDNHTATLDFTEVEL